MNVEKPIRQTQEERSRRMRTRLLEATLDCIQTLGYARASTTEIAKRAGVSRGAQVHHFPTKLDLVSAAAEYLMRDTLVRTKAAIESHTDPDKRLEAMLEVMWRDIFRGRMFSVTLELMLAARTDSDLHQMLLPLVERWNQLSNEGWRKYFTQSPQSQVQAETILNITVGLYRGLSMEMAYRRDPEVIEQMVEQWTKVVATLVRSKPGI